MPEANYLLSVSWGYIKVGLIPEGLLITELLIAFLFVLYYSEKASVRKICFKNADFCVFWLIMCVGACRVHGCHFWGEFGVAG